MSASYDFSSQGEIAVLRPRPGVAVVEFRGEHDLDGKAAVRSLLTGLVGDNHLVVVDVCEAEFIDSSFLHNLVLAHHLSLERGSTVRLQHGTAPIVRSALEHSGVLAVLNEARTREEALAAVLSET